MQAWLQGIGIALGITVGIWSIGKFLPGLIVKKLHAVFAWAKQSPWFKNIAKPKRAKLLFVLAEFLEDEIPEPGTGKEFYAALGNKIAGLSPILIGTGAKWAAALEKGGDAIDLALDNEIKLLAQGAQAGGMTYPSEPSK